MLKDKSMNEVTLINNAGRTVKVKLGYSFTTLLFGELPSLLRMDWNQFFSIMITKVLMAVVLLDSGVEMFSILLLSCWIDLAWGFFRNKGLLKMYLDKDWQIIQESNATKHDVDYFLGFNTTKKCWY